MADAAAAGVPAPGRTDAAVAQAFHTEAMKARHALARCPESPWTGLRHGTMGRCKSFGPLHVMCLRAMVVPRHLQSRAAIPRRAATKRLAN